MNPISIVKPTPSDPLAPYDRNYATALHHAHQIQLQKDASLLILSSLETLLDLPSSLSSSSHLPSPPASPSPLPQDIHLLKFLLPPFQPADYDALVQERNIDHKCGYVLCANPPTLQGTSAKYRILFGKGRGPDAFKVVERQELEKWCSDECGRRALFLRVQLGEEPAWLRGKGVEIKVLEEEAKIEEELIRGLSKMEVGEGEGDMFERMRALALERGDGDGNARASNLADVGVKENIGAGKTMPLAPKMGKHGAGSIEGYKPKIEVTNGMDEEDSDIDEDGRDIMETI